MSPHPPCAGWVTEPSSGSSTRDDRMPELCTGHTGRSSGTRGRKPFGMRPSEQPLSNRGLFSFGADLGRSFSKPSAKLNSRKFRKPLPWQYFTTIDGSPYRSKTVCKVSAKYLQSGVSDTDRNPSFDRPGPKRCQLFATRDFSSGCFFYRCQSFSNPEQLPLTTRAGVAKVAHAVAVESDRSGGDNDTHLLGNG